MIALLGFLDFVSGEAFLRPMHRNMLLVAGTPESCSKRWRAIARLPKPGGLVATSAEHRAASRRSNGADLALSRSRLSTDRAMRALTPSLTL